MNNITNKTQSKSTINRFSLGRGFLFFIKANVLLTLFIIIFLINIGDWGYEEIGGIILVFSFPAEIFIILLTIIHLFKPTEKKERQKDSPITKNEWIGMGLSIIIISLFSLLFLGAGLAYPSTIVFFILVTNFMFALYSLVFHPIAIGLYEGNVYLKKETIVDYIFKYIAILTSGINYHVQIILKKLPLVLNKLFAVVFALFLLWQFAMVIGIFEWT